MSVLSRAKHARPPKRLEGTVVSSLVAAGLSVWASALLIIPTGHPAVSLSTVQVGTATARSVAAKPVVAKPVVAKPVARPAVRATARPTVRSGPRSHAVEFVTVSVDSPAGVVRLIHQYFPESQWSAATRIARCESTLRANAVNVNKDGTRDLGVFQLNTGGTLQEILGLTGHPATDLNLAFNPVWNVRGAALLYHRDGWGRWTCAQGIV